MGKIILINPPSPFLIRQKSFVPLGLLYLAAALEEKGFAAHVIDLAGQEDSLEPAVTPYIKEQIFCITATTPQYVYAKKIRGIIKKNNPSAKIVIGGVHATSLPQDCLKDTFDIVVKGEGERAIIKVVRDLEKNNINYKTIRLPYIKDIDRIAYPARHLILIKDYGYDIDGRPAATLITSRGCPYTCLFCAKDVWQTGVRFHSIDYVVGELKSITNDYGTKYFLFLDDTFNINAPRLLKLCKGIKPLKIKWRCYCRADFNSKSILSAMKEAGCVEIGVGVESGSQEILDIIGKRNTVEKNTAFVSDCKKIGILVNAFLMIGLPGETHRTVEETKRWMEQALPDKFGFNIFMPYAKTPVWKNLRNYDLRISEIPEEHSWVKGRQGKYHCYVSTNELASSEILRLFYENFDYYSRLLNWKPGIGMPKTN